MKHRNLNLYLFLISVHLNFCSDCLLHGQTADASLKLHLSFDQDLSGGQVLDLSGNGNHGWRFNPTNWITATNGVFGSTAAQFTINFVMCDGTTNGQVYTNYPAGWPTNVPPGVHIYAASQYIGITNLNGFEYLTNATISYWARFDGGNSNQTMHLLDCSRNVVYAYAPSKASNSWVISHSGLFRYSEFSICPSSGGYRSVVKWPTQSGPSTPRFDLYTLTVDCLNNQAIAYYNGNPYQTNTINLPWLHIYGGPFRHWLSVGAMSFDGTPEWGDDRYPNSAYMSGKMDDVRIYNRTLAAAEVRALTNRFVDLAGIQKTNTESVQISWGTTSNAVYQVESVSNFTTMTWRTRGSPMPGTGTNQAFTDSLLGQPAQFYRVRILP